MEESFTTQTQNHFYSSSSSSSKRNIIIAALTIAFVVATLGAQTTGTINFLQIITQAEAGNATVEQLHKFNNWMIKNNKTWGKDEALARFDKWRFNKDKVKRHNAKNKTYKLGTNYLAHLSQEELAATHLGFKPSADDHDHDPRVAATRGTGNGANSSSNKTGRMLSYTNIYTNWWSVGSTNFTRINATTTYNKKIVTNITLYTTNKTGTFANVTVTEKDIPPPPFVKVPESVDWRKNASIVGPVKNQGGCGSCWTFAAIATVEGLYGKKYGKPIKLSEQQLIDCVGYGKGCFGGDSASGLSYIAKNGIATSDSYPYTGKNGDCNASNVPSAFQDIDYVNVAILSVNQLQAAVAQGPVAVAVRVSQNFSLYKSGVFDEKACYSDGDSLGHAVTVVGYTKDSWIIRNSWGSWWGEDGYIEISQDILTNPNGVCGMMAGRMHFPILKTV